MQVDEIAQHRLDNFSFKAGSGHRHGRSHSRNASVTNLHEITPSPQPQLQAAPTKRHSHHRRVSSVSTRRESAEIMGVPDTFPAEDELEKDSIRRHALLALEGKRDTKVEIPELSAPFEFPTKPSFPPGSGSFMNVGKRDSFKPPNPLTLIEEEEEENDCARSPPTPTTPTTPASFTRARPPRLRPLSLTPDSLPHLSTVPSPRRSSLKALALNPDATSPPITRPRPVLNLKLSTDSVPEDGSTRPSPLRRSSISYKVSTNAAGLPTPEATPVSERRFSGYSLSSRSSEGSLSIEDEMPSVTRPLSVSEQHFLFKSHNALLARITDLERALSFRTSPNTARDSNSRHVATPSVASATSGTSSTEAPLDEMLSLVADLKAERDELKRDVDGWRNRVGGLEKQLAVFQSRVEIERRDAWVARSRVELVTGERDQLQQRMAELEAENRRLTNAEADLKQQVSDMSSELEDVQSKLSRQLDPLSTPRAVDGPVRRGLGFTSLDSQSSGTDVDEFQPFGLGFKLRVVEEEGDEEDALAGYEEEDENDIILSPSSSFGSIHELATPRTADVIPAPTHTNQKSLSKWTFPKTFPKVVEAEPETDRFFPCLENLDEPPSPSLGSPSYLEYDEERSKGLFAKGFSLGDDSSCFVLPASVLASAEGAFMLDVVEEDEEQTVVEDGEVNGGIKITFTPPAEDQSIDSPVSDEESFDEAPVVTPPKPVTTRSSPSSLPRLVKPASFTLTSPPRSTSPASVTPPAKRPSFIPQPASPSRPGSQRGSFSTNAATKPSTAFIRQPARLPLMPKANSVKIPGTNADAASHSSLRCLDDESTPEMTDAGTSTIPSSTGSPPSTPSSPFSLMSSPISLSFQSLTNYIPSWGMASSPRSDVTPVPDVRPAAPAGPVKRGFVSKQSQLERLKTRLEREGLDGARSFAYPKKTGEDALFV